MTLAMQFAGDNLSVNERLQNFHICIFVTPGKGGGFTLLDLY